MRGPIDRLTEGLPHGWRVIIDWLVTIVGAIAIVLAIKAWVVNPYRIPSSSMEPTLHCARPGPGCEAGFSDRVLANRVLYHLRKPKRGDIIVFHAPKKGADALRVGGCLRQAPDRVARRALERAERLRVHQREAPEREMGRQRPPGCGDVAGADDRPGALFLHGRQPEVLVRLAPVGGRAA
jgi:hypothetical protein